MSEADNKRKLYSEYTKGVRKMAENLLPLTLYGRRYIDRDIPSYTCELWLYGRTVVWYVDTDNYIVRQYWTVAEAEWFFSEI